jgi:hypothetical protein
MFDPKSIRRGVQNTPRKVIIHGMPKIGKSTLASCAPDALLIPTEDRVDHIDCQKTDVIQSMDELISIFEYLAKGTMFQTVIIDTLDWLEPLLHDYVCKMKGFKNGLHDDKDANVNYGRGMRIHAIEGWKLFLNSCDELREKANMSIILLAHSSIEKINPPEASSYEIYSFKLDKHASAVVEEWANIIGFYNREVVVTKEDVGFGQKKGKALNVEGRRVLNLQATSPAWVSGNSYGLEDAVITIENAPEIMSYILNVNAKETKKGR